MTTPPIIPIQTVLSLRKSSPMRVALVNMPLSSAMRPSIQVGLLKAILREHGFEADTFHFNLDFAKILGLHAYEKMCDVSRVHFGEWLFSRATFGANDVADEAFCAEYREDVERLLRSTDVTRGEFETLRREAVPQFLDGLCDEVDWSSYAVVGFTSTFQQNVPSLGLAARLKARWPHLRIVFGGANCEGEMGLELAHTMRFIDYVVSGQGDVAFPKLMRALERNESPLDIPGVLTSESTTVTTGEGPQLETSPLPDYEEYFHRCERLSLLPSGSRIAFALPYEGSRGCWWGQKHHCTFCGLNGNSMAFRAKTATTVLRDLTELARRHRTFAFTMVDNILDTKYFGTLLPALIEEKRDYEFFFEVKANLTRSQLRSLRAAGVRRIQPGIESLSTHVLALMRKGITALQNVNTLRWSQYYGIAAAWNLLWGFPGETSDDYESQLRLMSRLMHLPPPSAVARLRLDRFSPLFFDSVAWPRAQLSPLGGYEYIYPSNVEPQRIAYYFKTTLEGQLPDSVYEPTKTYVEDWKKQWVPGRRRPGLLFRYSPDYLRIEDTRAQDRSPLIREYEGIAARVYEACSDEPTSLSGICRSLRLDESATSTIELLLADFCEDALMAEESGRYLSLALPASEHR